MKILAYLLIGEIPAVAFWFWAQVYCDRFIGKVKPDWRDLRWLVGVQVLWPVALLCAVFPVVLWRRAVNNEVCVCGHRRSMHFEGYSCRTEYRSSQWIVNGEGPEYVDCQCPKFTMPAVRKRR